MATSRQEAVQQGDERIQELIDKAQREIEEAIERFAGGDRVVPVFMHGSWFSEEIGALLQALEPYRQTWKIQIDYTTMGDSTGFLVLLH